jgi:hypothetical protein
MLSAEAFVAELDIQNRSALDRIAVACSAEPGPELTVIKLLGLALKNEIEATECAAAWIGSTPGSHRMLQHAEIQHPVGSTRETGEPCALRPCAGRGPHCAIRTMRHPSRSR